MAKRKKSKKTAKATLATAPRGQVGLQTFEQVRKIADEKKIPLTKAFAQVAQATGRSAGTIAVTYYRIAKQKGVTGRKRSRGRAATRRGSAQSSSPIKSILSRVSAAVAELENVIAKQSAEIGRLRKESALAERIRKAMRA